MATRIQKRSARGSCLEACSSNQRSKAGVGRRPAARADSATNRRVSRRDRAVVADACRSAARAATSTRRARPAVARGSRRVTFVQYDRPWSASRRPKSSSCTRSMSSTSADHCASERSSGRSLNATSHSRDCHVASAGTPSRCRSIVWRSTTPRSAASRTATACSRCKAASAPSSVERRLGAREHRPRAPEPAQLRVDDLQVGTETLTDRVSAAQEPRDRRQVEVERAEESNDLEVRSVGLAVQAIARIRALSRREHTSVGVVADRLDRNTGGPRQSANGQQAGHPVILDSPVTGGFITMA